MEPTRKTIEQDGVSYVFRLPTAKDMIQIDLKARELRQGLSEGLNLAFIYADGIATLTQLCEEPKKVDFGEIPAHVMDALVSEVSEWIGSFRKPVGDKQGAVGQG